MPVFRLSTWLFVAGGALCAAGLVASASSTSSVDLMRDASFPEQQSTPLAVVAQAETTPDSLSALPDKNCRDCHTDQDQMKLLAKPLEVAESHSEGPG